MRIDPVTLQIFANHAQAAADSMAFTLFRTAYSTFVKETEDFTTGLATPDGMTFASPRDLGATWFIGLDYANAIRMVDDYQPGDICITNDPYSGFVCTHTPDLHMWKPIFWEDELVAFAVSHIHNTDVGGAVPASLSRQLTEVHQEGIRIPPNKLYEAGQAEQAVARCDADQRAHARSEPRRPAGADRGHEHRRAQGARHGAQVRRRRVPPGRQGPARPRRTAGPRPAQPHPGRRLFLRRLPRRGRAGRRARAARPDPEDPRRRGGHGLLRVRRPAAIVAQRADRRRRAPHPADGRLHLLPLQHRPDDPPERRHHAAGALRHPRGHDPQPAIPGRRRHAQHDLRPAAGCHHRRVPVGGARPAAGRPRRQQRHHERQDDRQPERPYDHGLDRPDHRRRRRLVGRRRRRRLGRQFELPQEHAGRDQRDRGADQGAALRPGARHRRRRQASRRACAPCSSSRCSRPIPW